MVDTRSGTFARDYGTGYLFGRTRVLGIGSACGLRILAAGSGWASGASAAGGRSIASVHIQGRISYVLFVHV